MYFFEKLTQLVYGCVGNSSLHEIQNTPLEPVEIQHSKAGFSRRRSTRCEPSEVARALFRVESGIAEVVSRYVRRRGIICFCREPGIEGIVLFGVDALPDIDEAVR